MPAISRKSIKLLSITIFLVISFFIIKSRRVDPVSRNIMVISTKQDIINKCKQYYDFKLGKTNKQPYIVNSKYSLDVLCYDIEKINEVAETRIRDYYRDNFLFVF